MAEREPYEDLVSKAITRQDNAIVPNMARFLSPVSGQQTVKGTSERMLWWEADPTVDVNLLRQGGATPEQLSMLAERDPRMTPEQIMAQGGKLTDQQIGLLKFPHRSILMQSGGRADDVGAQTAYVEHMVKQGPPDEHPDDPFTEVREQVETAPAPPNPDSGLASLGQMGGLV